jgi:hypothetical protein
MNKPSSLRLALQFGAYSGVASFIFFVLTFFAGYNPLGQSSWLSLWVPVLFVTMGMKQYKNIDCKGYLPYGEAVRVGLRISIATAFVFASCVYIFGSTAVGNSFVEMFKIDTLEQFEASKAVWGQELYEKNITSLNIVNLTIISFSLALFKIVGGLFISFIIAAFVKNSNVSFVNEEEIEESNITSTEQNQ